jgi:hypothetical protein
VAVGVIDRLEVVQIQHDQAERPLLPARPRQLLLHAGEDVALVVGAGQLVLVGRGVQAELVAQLVLAHHPERQRRPAAEVDLVAGMHLYRLARREPSAVAAGAVGAAEVGDLAARQPHALALRAAVVDVGNIDLAVVPRDAAAVEEDVGLRIASDEVAAPPQAEDPPGVDSAEHSQGRDEVARRGDPVELACLQISQGEVVDRLVVEVIQ